MTCPECNREMLLTVVPTGKYWMCPVCKVSIRHIEILKFVPKKES